MRRTQVRHNDVYSKRICILTELPAAIEVRHNDVYSKRVYLTVSSSVYYFLSILENSYIIFNPIQRQNKKDAPFSVAPFFILLQKDSLNIQDNL